MSALLLDERLLCYQPALVRRLGLAEAAIVQQLHFWAPHATHTYEGERWVYKTYGDWSDEIGISSKAVRGALDRLRRDGIVIAVQSPLDQRDRTLWWRIDYDALRGQTPSGAPSAPTGSPADPQGSSHAGDRGRTESTTETTKGGNARADGLKTDPKTQPPPDFPDELRPHAREVMRVLTAVAKQHGCKKVWPLEVGRAIMARPRHPLVAVAHDLAGWAADPPRPILDVVSTYRTFLKREKELADVERLADDGTPTSVPGANPRGVTPIRRNGRDERNWMTRRHMALANGASEDEARAFASGV